MQTQAPFSVAHYWPVSISNGTPQDIVPVAGVSPVLTSATLDNVPQRYAWAISNVSNAVALCQISLDNGYFGFSLPIYGGQSLDNSAVLQLQGAIYVTGKPSGSSAPLLLTLSDQVSYGNDSDFGLGTPTLPLASQDNETLICPVANINPSAANSATSFDLTQNSIIAHPFKVQRGADPTSVSLAQFCFGADGQTLLAADSQQNYIYVLHFDAQTHLVTQPDPNAYIDCTAKGSGADGFNGIVKQDDGTYYALLASSPNNELLQVVHSGGSYTLAPNSHHVSVAGQAPSYNTLAINNAGTRLYIVSVNGSNSNGLLYDITGSIPVLLSSALLDSSPITGRGVLFDSSDSNVYTQNGSNADPNQNGFLVIDVQNDANVFQSVINHTSGGTVIPNLDGQLGLSTLINPSNWDQLQVGDTPFIEKQELLTGGTPSASRQFGVFNGVLVEGGNNNWLEMKAGEPIIKVHGTPPNINASFLGGFSADPNAVMYFVFDLSNQYVSGPIVLFPNSKMNTNQLPNAFIQNSNASGEWDSKVPRSVSRVQLYREVGTLTVGSRQVVDVNSPTTDAQFQDGDQIVFITANYRGQPFTDQTLLNTTNWRISYSDSVSLPNMPVNTDTTFLNGTNSHYAIDFLKCWTSISSTPQPPPIVGVLALGSEDREFSRSDGDFQDVVFTLDIQNP